MPKMPIIIRTATPEDAPAILTIYAPYVVQTAITFEYEIPSLEDFTERIIHTLKRYPYLVAICDSEIVGYAYVGPFHARPAYDWTVETSIYVRMDCKRKGIGHALYEALEEILKRQGILNMEACIAYPELPDEYLTRDSVFFHEKNGYRMVGEFYQCGFKFNRWYNMVWMEKLIGEHTVRQAPIIPFPEL